MFAKTPLFAALAAVVASAPLEKRAGPGDGVILNYALTLEHLENTFYREAVARFTADDFAKAGAKPTFYGNLKEIAADEKTHVDFLTGALMKAGVQPVKACTYDFGYTDVKGFLATANILEGVGVSAYLGAANLIANPDYLTAAGSILTVESRHSAYLRDNQLPPQSPFPAPFDIPLMINEVYSLAAPFFKSCPKDNPALPVKAFPGLTLGAIQKPVRPGNALPISSAVNLSGPVYAYFVSVTGPIAAPVRGSGRSFSVTVPDTAPAGQSYLVFTKQQGNVTDDTIIAGPAIIPVQSRYTYGWVP